MSYYLFKILKFEKNATQNYAGNYSDLITVIRTKNTKIQKSKVQSPKSNLSKA